jgi:hypothetical protein
MKRVVRLILERFVRLFGRSGEVFRPLCNPLGAIGGAALGTFGILGARAQQAAGMQLAVSLFCGLLLWGGVLHYAVTGACALWRRTGGAP